jgi:LemA protein
MAGWIAAGVLLILPLYAAMLYNGLVDLKQDIASAWINIDRLLKERHDALPKLIDACRQCQELEPAMLQTVADARSRVASARERCDVPALDAAEGAMRRSLGRLLELAPACSGLCSGKQFMQLQWRIASLENALADRRELYNDAVRRHNLGMAQLPHLIVARLAGFDIKPRLEFEDGGSADADGTSDIGCNKRQRIAP